MSGLQFPSEAFIEDYVFQYITDNGKCPISGRAVNYHVRQPRLGPYGVADIIKVSYGANIRITVLELKNTELKIEHIAQLARYMKGVKRIAERYKSKFKECPAITVKGELAGIVNVDNTDINFIMDELKGDIAVYDIKATMSDGFIPNGDPNWWHYSSRKYLSEEARMVLRDVRLIAEHQESEKAKLAVVRPIKDSAGTKNG